MSTKSKTIRWGILGCGNVTERKSGPAYQQTPGFELAAVMRRDRAKAEDYAQRHRVSYATDNADELIHHPSIDAIYIATPPDSHMDYALTCAEAGKICCVEKPLTGIHSESIRIVDAFIERNLPLFVAYYRRTLPRFLKVKTLLEQKSIGSLRQIQWTFSRPPSQQDLQRANPWRTRKEVAPGGYFDDLASHGLDVFAYLMGDFETVKGVATNQQSLYTSMDAVSACWSHKTGVTGSGSWNFGSALSEDRVEIQGDQGVIRFSVFDEKPVVLQTQQSEESFELPHPDPIQRFHVQAMADQLFKGVPQPSTGATALHTSWVMDQILFGK